MPSKSPIEEGLVVPVIEMRNDDGAAQAAAESVACRLGFVVVVG